MKFHIIPIILLFKTTIVLCQPGELDVTFNGTGKVLTSVPDLALETNAMLIQPDGKILVSGASTSPATLRDFMIARYETSGTLDTSFNHTGMVTIDFFGRNDFGYDVALQPDNKILLTGTILTVTAGRKTGLVRLHQNGSLDYAFGVDGKVVSELSNNGEDSQAALIQPDGSIITAGSVTFSNPYHIRSSIIKYTPDGLIDTGFGNLGMATALVPEGYNPSFGILQPDGKIITGGTLLGVNDIIMLRYQPDGSLDQSFGDNGIVQTDLNGGLENAYAIKLQADKKILLVVGLMVGNERDFCMIRYHEDGSIDSSFGTDGKVITDFNQSSNTSHALAIQADQKILLGGFVGTSPNQDFAMARYHNDGSLDTEFGMGGRVVTDFGRRDLAFAMAIQPDHRIVLAGHSIDNNTLVSSIAIARYLSGLETVNTRDPSFDMHDIVLYPNPVSKEAILKYNLPHGQTISIRLYDLSGKVIHIFMEKVRRGNGDNEEKLNFHSNLLPGNYILLFESRESAFGMPIVLKSGN